jgi:hypothetical protein
MLARPFIASNAYAIVQPSKTWYDCNKQTWLGVFTSMAREPVKRNTRKKGQTKQKSQKAQRFDTSFKAWIRAHPSEILPQLLPGVTYVDTLDVEIIRSTMRADKVFKVKYDGEDAILEIEFESGTDGDLPSRLLIYNAVLYQEHKLPIITIVVYPFRVTLAESPLQVTIGDNTILAFHFHMLPLFQLNAEQFVRDHVVCMYPLLPTMQGVHHEMIKQVTDELVALYREDEVTLADQLIWMSLLLERTDTIPLQEKSEIERQLHMYDALWEESPRIQQERAKSKAEGELQAAQAMFVNIVSARFPNLTEQAKEKVAQINNPTELNILARKVVVAPDEDTVRWLLIPPVAS